MFNFFLIRSDVKELFHPRYWLIWLCIFILYLLTYLPYKVNLQIGKIIGMLFYFLPSKIKNLTRSNIALCFPELSASQQRSIVKKNFSNLGAAVMETAFAWWANDQKLRGLLSIKGFEHVEQALASGHGVILLSQHFTCLELIGRLMIGACSFNALYKSPKNKFLSYLLLKYRKKHYIPSTNMRQAINILRNKQLLWYAYDVDGGKSSAAVFAPFFGIPASSLTTISKLARFTDAVVIPTYFRRCDKRYEIIFSPPLTNFPTQDLVADATRLNNIVANAIRQQADQYLWLYKRFKTRPPGEKSFYD